MCGLAQRLKSILWLLQFIIRTSGLLNQDTRWSYQSETSSNEPTAHLPNYHVVFASASLGQFLLVFFSFLHYHYFFSSTLWLCFIHGFFRVFAFLASLPNTVLTQTCNNRFWLGQWVTVEDRASAPTRQSSHASGSHGLLIAHKMANCFRARHQSLTHSAVAEREKCFSPKKLDEHEEATSSFV